MATSPLGPAQVAPQSLTTQAALRTLAIATAGLQSLSDRFADPGFVAAFDQLVLRIFALRGRVIIGGIVALAVKVATRRPTMPIWPIVPFALWGVVRALIRAWHVFS